jgi:hypothetical protein
VTFPVPVTAQSVCPGQSGNFVINGTVTIANAVAPGNDKLYFTPAPSQCTGGVTGFASNGTGTHAGYIDLGSPSFVTSNATFTSSTLSFNPVTNNIQVTLGGSHPGGGQLGTVKTATATYYPDSAIQSTTGVSVSGSVTAPTILTVTQPSAVSIASTTASPNGTPSSGDQIVYTYSEPMDPSSILSTWNGASTSVIACFGRQANGSTLFGVATSTGCVNTLVNLGTVSLGDSGTYYIAANSLVTLTATMSMATVNGQSVVTVTLTSNGSFNSVKTSTSWTWTPSTSAADLAGNPLSAALPSASSSKENFGPLQLATSAKLTQLRSTRLLRHLARIV